MVLVLEIKTVVADLGSLLRGLDVKERLAARVAGSLGRHVGRTVVPLLVVSATSTNRRRLVAHSSLLDRFATRGQAAIGWIRNPRPLRA
jgi:hypothetical protein